MDDDMVDIEIRALDVMKNLGTRFTKLFKLLAYFFFAFDALAEFLPFSNPFSNFIRAKCSHDNPSSSHEVWVWGRRIIIAQPLI